MRFVLDARHAARPGGFATYLHAVGSRLPALSAPGESLRCWNAPGAEPVAEGPHVTQHTVHAPGAGFASLLWPGRLDALRSDDVFHATANVLGFGLRCRTVVTLHDILWLTHPEWCQPKRWARPFSRRYYRAGILHGLSAATRIITVSSASADDILLHAPKARARLVVIPNAADPEYRPPASASDAQRVAREHLGFDAPYFLVLGMNQVSKGHSYALRAFAALGACAARLVFVQRVNRGGELQELARSLGVAERVSFLSALPKAAIVPLMQSALALVHPSLWEGFGIPPLEAMSVGCPVIASDIPALREVVGSAGLLVKPACSSGIHEAMKQLLNEPALRVELAGRGLLRAQAFSWDKTAAQTLQVYRDAASS